MSNQTRRRFSDEFKEEAVKLITEQGYKVSEASRNLDINASMLRRWQRELSPESDGSIDADEKAELQRLRKENKTLRMEREILKKAAAFFAKESK
jgi:transposase